MFNDAIPEGTGSCEPGLRQMNDATEGKVRANNISPRFFFIIIYILISMHTYKFVYVS